MFDSTAFIKFKMDTCRAFESLGVPLKIATCIKDINRVVKFIAEEYKTAFPEIRPEETNDYIINSFNFYTEDDNGEIDGTISLVVDSALGFPDEQLLCDDIRHYRDNGQLLLEAGRFVVKSGNAAKAMNLLQTLYLLPKLIGATAAIGMIRPKDLTLHEKRFGAKVLKRSTGKTYGSSHDFITVAWEVDSLTRQYFAKTGCPKLESSSNTLYRPRDWDSYATAFGSVQTQFQRELQLAAAHLLHGNVADFGCGTAKLAPLLADNPRVLGYTGIDNSKDMIKSAQNLIAPLNKPGFFTWQGKIEHFAGQQFDSAVSINSFYSWPHPPKVLAHISTLLKIGATLVLATPNRKIAKQMPKMLHEAEKELMLHPFWSSFKAQNMAFVQNRWAHFVDMDELIDQAHKAGFAVQSCHQSFYLGSLNFLELKKVSEVKQAA